MGTASRSARAALPPAAPAHTRLRGAGAGSTFAPELSRRSLHRGERTRPVVVRTLGALRQVVAAGGGRGAGRARADHGRAARGPPDAGARPPKRAEARSSRSSSTRRSSARTRTSRAIRATRPATSRSSRARGVDLVCVPTRRRDVSRGLRHPHRAARAAEAAVRREPARIIFAGVATVVAKLFRSRARPRGVRREGLPAARDHPPMVRDLDLASRSSACRSCASRTASRCPRVRRPLPSRAHYRLGIGSRAGRRRP